MTVEQAKQNIENLINVSRLMKQEYDALMESLKVLYDKTK